jgi:hypothetical protein
MCSDGARNFQLYGHQIFHFLLLEVDECSKFDLLLGFFFYQIKIMFKWYTYTKYKTQIICDNLIKHYQTLTMKETKLIVSG